LYNNFSVEFVNKFGIKIQGLVHFAYAESFRRFRKIAKSSSYRLCVSLCLLVRPHGTTTNRTLNMKTYAHLRYLAVFILKCDLFRTKVSDEFKTLYRFSYVVFQEILPYMRQCGEILYGRTGNRRQYGACSFHAGYMKPQTHIQSMYYTLLFAATMVAETRLSMRYIYKIGDEPTWALHASPEVQLLFREI
jgi:hypothetical protein